MSIIGGKGRKSGEPEDEQEVGEGGCWVWHAIARERMDDMMADDGYVAGVSGGVSGSMTGCDEEWGGEREGEQFRASRRNDVALRQVGEADV